MIPFSLIFLLSLCLLLTCEEFFPRCPCFIIKSLQCGLKLKGCLFPLMLSSHCAINHAPNKPSKSDLWQIGKFSPWVICIYPSLTATVLYCPHVLTVRVYLCVSVWTEPLCFVCLITKLIIFVRTDLVRMEIRANICELASIQMLSIKTKHFIYAPFKQNKTGKI